MGDLRQKRQKRQKAKEASDFGRFCRLCRTLQGGPAFRRTPTGCHRDAVCQTEPLQYDQGTVNLMAVAVSVEQVTDLGPGQSAGRPSKSMQQLISDRIAKRVTEDAPTRGPAIIPDRQGRTEV